MTERLAVKLANAAVMGGIIKKEDHDLYVYSYQIMLERTMGWGCIFLTSLLFGTLPYALLFALFFWALSMFTGGWHAPGFGLCFLMSVGVFLGVSILEPFVTAELPMYVVMGIILCCSAVISLLGPIADSNKPMDEKSLKRCKKIAFIVLLVEMAIAIVFFAAKHSRALVFIMFSFVVIASSLLTAHGKIKEHRNRRCKL